MDVHQKALQAFIDSELKRRDWSYRALADAMGVAPSTITRIMDQKKPAEITLEFLVKLSKATNVSLEGIIGMVYPDVSALRATPSSMVLAQQIEQLPDHLQMAIRALIASGK